MASPDDFKDYWNEYRLHQENKVKDDNITEDFAVKLDEDEGEQDAELLRAMGMGHLSEAFRHGREVPDAELDESLRQLSTIQADTVRRRVRSLNHTVRTRRRHAGARQTRSGWTRKPDIREVFRDVETSSTGTRSRSATPDSLDSVGNLVETDPDPSNPWSPPEWDNIRQSSPPSLIGSVPSFVKIFDNPNTDTTDETANIAILDQQDGIRISIGGKESLRRTPSAPPSCHRSSTGATPSSYPPVLPPHEMFRRPGPWPTNLYRVDVASDTEGIELLGYNRIGTIHLSRPSRERVRSGSDPMTVASTLRLSHLKLSNSDIRALVDSSSSHGLNTDCDSMVRSQNSLYVPVPEISASSGPISFETIFHKNMTKQTDWVEDCAVKSNPRISVESLKDLDFRDLKPFLWLEVCAIFDKYSIAVRRRKPLKRKRKEDGNVFGVNLSTLVMRDFQLLNDNSSVPVPLIFRSVLSRLSGAGAKDEGILRIAGHRQKVEMFCNEIENNFYTKSDELRLMFQRASSHDVTAILKRLLRDLPQPLLTIELIDLFYQSHGVTCEEDQTRVLNLLVLLLPIENRSTLFALLKFLVDVVNNQESNKMNLHNVAMIMAPSLFPPRYVHPINKNDLNAQIVMAATCCHVVERLINSEGILRTVPVELLSQARRCSREAMQRKRRKDQKNAKVSPKGRKDIS